jgi:Ca-activated chloride channel family protein
MDDLLNLLQAFHFLRPWWLLSIALICLLWWIVRRRDRLQPSSWAMQLAPHLRGAMTVNQTSRSGLRPVDLIASGLILAALATAGPAWQRIPNPFFAETAPLIVILENTPTMQANDVLPTRLERAKVKIWDLMQLRAGGRTALVTFAGSAHLVLPPTEDPKIVKPFLEGLDPDIMPRAGQNGAAALELAHGLLVREQTPGSILFITDGLDSADVPALAAYQAQPDAAGVVMLVLGTEQGGIVQRADGTFATGADGTVLDTGLDRALIDRLAAVSGVSVIETTPDNTDLAHIQRRVTSNLQNALDKDEAAAWDDQGWWLAWPGALLFLAWFRRGLTMQWSWLLLCGLGTGLLAPTPAYADPLDWFLTPDQQGRYAYEHKQFGEAADLFEDPTWKGVAAYRAGRYLEAAQMFARVSTAQGFYNMGNSYIKGREYYPAVEAFRQAVAQEPDFAAAQHNLEVAEYIVGYLNRLREQSDTGDESELGADEFKFDNKTDKGTEIVITNESRLQAKSVDQWMRAVDTQPRDFLRLKFALEADREGQP